MTYGEPSKVKFIINKPVFPGGPIVSWAIVLQNPSNETMVAGWVNL